MTESLTISEVAPPMTPELKHAFQDLIIDPETQGMIDAWKTQYGTSTIGSWFEDDPNNPTPTVTELRTGTVIMDAVMKKLTTLICCQNPEDSGIRKRDTNGEYGLLTIISQTGDRDTMNDREAHFSFWYSSFPKGKPLSELITDRGAKQSMIKILDRLVANKVQTLADPLIEGSDQLSKSLRIFEVVPKETMYGKPTSDFIKLHNDFGNLETDIGTRSISILGILQYRRDLQARGNVFRENLVEAFRGASRPVQEAIAKQWNDVIPTLFGRSSAVSRISSRSLIGDSLQPMLDRMKQVSTNA